MIKIFLRYNYLLLIITISFKYIFLKYIYLKLITKVH